ncbi:type I-F CRISPR-associated protein Csy2 [Vibrio sp. CAU 1672]|uniref:type I-F CRISPR-associated protein Csy2 n=1 Tax=Vibrio sp. CAU 1672 TaxID=3032594 RepID=UPI0023DC4E33|nr:type I-F CRISPR-associated protein Csy2 [Vibrio sp. CAU 1672]MDF2152877.1 type I-F CRISPR-associated protein Csy2 [Vibrio sp. CAU 1672]
MTKLSDVLQIEDDVVKQTTLKKVFMPYSEDIDIDGCEIEALTVLLNLSFHRKDSKCNNWLDDERAKIYLTEQDNVTTSLAEIQWFHTHNLKYPDCRVCEQKIIGRPLPAEDDFISSAKLEVSLGWAHNAATYRYTIWLLNSFTWQSQSTNIVFLIQQKDPVWLGLLREFGLSEKSLERLRAEIELQLCTLTFPSYVNSYSKQLRFPWNGDYISVTPVASHAMQTELEHRYRDVESGLKFVTFSQPNSASIGNLCGSSGGYMHALNYPLDVPSSTNRPSRKTLVESRLETGRYLDNFQMTNERICKVLSRLSGAEPLRTHKQRIKARNDQSKILRKQVALWMLPLIELRDRIDSDERERAIEEHESLVQGFLTLPESELPTLASLFNQRLHLVFQENKFTRKFAYHPKLIQVVKAQVVWVLNKLSKPQKNQDRCEGEQYIYLSSLRVQDSLAMSCPYLCGAPSLTAIWGFVHHYQRELNRITNRDGLYEFSGFSIYIRSQSITAGAKLTEPSSLATARTISKAKRPTIRSDRLADLEMDLVIRVKSNGRLSDHCSELICALPLSLAGGSVYQPLLSSKIDWLRTFSSRSSLFYSLKGLPAYGRWLYPSEQQPESFDEMESMLAKDEGYLPVLNGFHFLEHPTPRSNALTALHTYAENTLTVAKQIIPIDMRFAGSNHFFGEAFWSLECSSTTILVKKCKEQIDYGAVSST